MLKINPSKSQERSIYDNKNSFQLWQSSDFVPLKREKIIAKFTQEELDSCWASLSTNIIQNIIGEKPYL